MSPLCAGREVIQMRDREPACTLACERDTKIIELPLKKPDRAPSLAALSVEFVAAPCEAKRVSDLIPADIDRAFAGVDGYAGCMVLVADQEARLVTVLTLWSGPDRAARCNENTEWVKRLLVPYVDHWVRARTLVLSLKGRQLVSWIGQAENRPPGGDEDRP